MFSDLAVAFGIARDLICQTGSADMLPGGWVMPGFLSFLGTSGPASEGGTRRGPSGSSKGGGAAIMIGSVRFGHSAMDTGRNRRNALLKVVVTVQFQGGSSRARAHRMASATCLST